ncbi:MAG: 4-(cytidine 5'-diphospho)-2-C-methyl-D-erythritol kinase [Paracoccaceae bacterium]
MQATAADGIAAKTVLNAAWRLAPAKINLTLSLKGQRADGYHLLNSLVAFAGVGDRLAAEPASGLSLAISGPFADGLSAGGDNLVLRAAESLAAGSAMGAALHLEKNLPLASGIGGGSSDAAAALKLLEELWAISSTDELARTLGADVPVCCAAPVPQIMRGIGDDLTPAPDLPAAWVVLVNPLVGVPTAAVFSNVSDKHPPSAPSMPEDGFECFAAFTDWLTTQRNDLQSAAIAVCPIISEVLQALSEAPLARMSGSGATCFALVEHEAEALELAQRVRNARPWWVAAAPLLS